MWNNGDGEWQAQDIALALSELDDVDLTGLQDGDMLVYDNGTSEWMRAVPVTSINDLSDVGAFTQVKGDLLVSNGTNFLTVAVGTNGYVLTADSAQTTGVAWTPTSGTSIDDDARKLALIGW